MEITSISNLLTYLEKLNSDSTIWYRGQSSCEWKLIPQYFRYSTSTSESTLISRFKQSASLLLNPKPVNSFEWLFLMQHYGVPTRLLDWSESPLVALYFSVTEDIDKDGALWLLYPSELNKLSGIHNKHEERFIPSFDDEHLENYTIESVKSSPHITLGPIATIATRNNSRIQAQLGVFTVHHLDKKAIEEIATKEHIIKLTIPKASKENIKKQLALLGYSKFQLFPELSSIGAMCKEFIR